MQRRAIRVTEKTLPLIRESKAIDPDDTVVMAEFLHLERYFSYVVQPEGEDCPSAWSTWPEDTFKAAFKFDEVKIQSEFVDIEPR